MTYSATAPVKSLAGTASAPGITFTGDNDTGLFSPGANQLAVTTGGVQRLLVGSDGTITPAGSFLSLLGSVTAPSLSFSGDPNTGIYSPGADQVSVATGGIERLRFDNSGQVEAVSLGTALLPVWTYLNDPNTGIYSPGADQLAISTNGIQRLTTDTAAVTSTLPIVHPIGAVGTPSITFAGNLNTGLYSPTTGICSVSTGGVERVRFDSTTAPLKEVFNGVLYPVVTQIDIGTDANKIPINAYLGALAFVDEVPRLRPGASVPQGNLDINFEYVSDTSIRIRMRGADGTVRSTTLTLS